jgi:hypothetical protein
MKVAVFGTFCLDEIHLPDGTVTRDLGGIAYTVPALAHIAPKFRIIPAANVGRDLFDDVVELLGQFPNVDRRWLNPVDEENNRIALRYSDDFTRTEEQFGGVPPLDSENHGAADGCDAALVNFISGGETDEAGLAEIARRVPFVYCDLHSYTLTHPDEGPREHRQPPGWQEMVSHCNAVQCNREEQAALFGGSLPSGGVVAASREVLSLGPDVMFVTDGARGAWMVRREGDGSVWPKFVKAGKTGKVVDPTGCGDVFGAAAFSALVSGVSPEDALRFAARIGSLAATLSGISSISKLASGG